MKQLFSSAIHSGSLDPESYGKNAQRGDPAYVMHRSSLLEFSACPAKWIDSPEPESTDAMEWGSLMDARVLTPDWFAKRYIVSPATYPCEPSKRDPRTEKPWTLQANYCKEWTAAQKSVGLVPITRPDYDQSSVALARLAAQDWWHALIGSAQCQQYVVGAYHDRQTDLVVPVKCLIDIVPCITSDFYGECLADFKTTADASPASWARTCFKHGYDVQAAMSLQLWNSATKQERICWCHAIQENRPPYQTARRILSHSFVQLGADRLVGALTFYAKCLKENRWPDYEGMQPETLDGWLLTQPEEWMALVAAPYLFTKLADPTWVKDEPEPEVTP